MNYKDNTNPANSPQIFPFPVENHQPQLSIKTDDADAGAFYSTYYPMVYRRCLAILRNKEDAQDMAHGVFEKIQKLKSKGRFTVTYPKTYLSKTALNMSINEIKRVKSERKKLIEMYDMATNGSLNRLMDTRGQAVWEAEITDNGHGQIEAEIIVQAILDEQDETTRKIYFYKYHDDMNLEQIGELTGLGKSAVQKRIKALEKQVRVKMGSGW